MKNSTYLKSSKLFPILFSVLSLIIFYPASVSASQNRTISFTQPQDTIIVNDSGCNGFTSSKDSTILLRNNTADFIDSNQSESPFSIINKEEYDFENFRFFGNVLKNHFPVSINDFGIFGQPHEVTFFGLGSGNISVLQNGISFEENYSGLFDFHRFSVNSISSVNLAPLSRGFLYGYSMNPVSVNFNYIKENFPIPHTRIFYFQGPDDEAMINVFFNTPISKKLFLTLDVSNAVVTPEYSNSDFSTWHGNAELNYIADSTFVLSLLYSKNHTVNNLYGGVNIDSIISDNAENFDEYFYTGYLAPVNYSTRKMDSEQNNLIFTINKKFSENHSIIFNGSYFNYQTKLKDDEMIPASKLRESNSYGINLTYAFDNSYIQSNTRFSSFYSTNYGFNYSNNSISFSGGLKLFNNTLKPSVFGRIMLTGNNQKLGGGGFDIVYSLSKLISFYVGASKYSRNFLPVVYYYSIPTLDENQTQQIETAETNLNIKTEYLLLTAGAFYFNNKSDISYYWNKQHTYINGAIAERNISGIHLNGKVNLFKFSLEFNYTYLNSKLNNVQTAPKHIINAGLFYSDLLFNDNLNMKTGFYYYFTGGQNYFYRDFFNGRNILFYETNNNLISPIDYYPSSTDSFTFDFFFVGRLQDRANIYFVWENLLDKKYFIVPFYPKQRRGIRIGVSWDLYN